MGAMSNVFRVRANIFIRIVVLCLLVPLFTPASAVSLFVPSLKEEGSVVFSVERDYYQEGFTRSGGDNSYALQFGYQTDGFFKVATTLKTVDLLTDPAGLRGSEYQLKSIVGFDFDFPGDFVRFDFGLSSMTTLGQLPRSANATITISRTRCLSLALMMPILPLLLFSLLITLAVLALPATIPLGSALRLL